jgi:hypothetical protein
MNEERDMLQASEMEYMLYSKLRRFCSQSPFPRATMQA